METPLTDLRDVLRRVAQTYDRGAGTKAGVPAQEFLRGIHTMALPLPAGLHATGNGGNGGAAVSPWIGIFDPDVSEDSQEGLYLAYIFSADLAAVSLTLQQGVERLKNAYPSKAQLRERLRRNAGRLQSAMLRDALKGWDEPLRLGAERKHWRPHTYEAGSVAARRYETAALPPEATLRDDLWEAADLLELAAHVERSVWYLDPQDEPFVSYEPDPAHQPVPGERAPRPAPETLDHFRPKNDADYVAHVPARTQRKTRRHETLVAEFGGYVKPRGFLRNTQVHPKDLVLRRGDAEWLVEAKVVKAGNPTRAVREAVGQLFEYRHFFADRDRPPRLLALFTEDVRAYVDYLETLGIGSVWKTPEGWSGSRSAVDWGIVDG
ncbi:DUF3578 domain-containing protein [Streptomyces marincola]|nr:DUF3578 domain-containing protein [Streptomyces marincola]